MISPFACNYAPLSTRLTVPQSASANDCIALCCQTSTCVALSYNNPQPEFASIGGTSCLAGGVCCMLKGTVPPLNASNPYPPGTVRSAALTVPPTAPAPTPPFPESTFISSAALVGPRTTWCDGKACGDTWPSALTASGRTFAWVCDSKFLLRWTRQVDIDSIRFSPLQRIPLDPSAASSEHGAYGLNGTAWRPLRTSP